MRRTPFALAVILASACAPDDPDASPDASTSAGESSSAESDPDTTPADDDDDGTTTAPADGSTDGTTGEPLPPIVPGLFAEYYAGYDARVLARVETAVDVDWAEAAPDPALPADRFSVRWSGWITPTESGAHTIVTETDDGVRLWIDDQLVVDDWTPHFVTRNEGAIELVANTPVPIVLELFEVDLASSARLSWATATAAEAPIPPEAFTTYAEIDDAGAPKPPYRNPSLKHDGGWVGAEAFRCADPGVIHVPDADMPGYYAACTAGTFPIRYSPDLVFWQETDATILPSGKASWSEDGTRNWAPEIHRVGTTFVAYFTSKNTGGTLAVGAAVADDVLGPYVDTGAPLVTDPQSVIDATYVEADGKGWLFYKIDGNAHGNPTPIFVRELAFDGLSFAEGTGAVQAIVNDLGWEGGVVEAPWIVKRDGMFYLFYSGNVYDERYRTGVARSRSITGPYEKLGDPILRNDSRWVGPGHGSVVTAGDVDVFVYHAWTNAGGVNDEDAGRQMLVDRIDWTNGWPSIHDGTPSDTWQPWPGTP